MKKFRFTIGGDEFDVELVSQEGNTIKVEVNGTEYEVELHKEVVVPKTPILVRAEVPPPTKKETRITRTIVKTTNTSVKSPLPGTIVTVLVKDGDNVKIGQKLLTMEAMKMENNVLAERDGIVCSVRVKPGDSVLQNDILLEIGQEGL
ncbi:MAG TPA: biotin/lipoyl-containing protein [Bacteroidales bacterium]|nr:biotin/lipoyl-containing protein [Bacteroidales bacterium]